MTSPAQLMEVGVTTVNGHLARCHAGEEVRLGTDHAATLPQRLVELTVKEMLRKHKNVTFTNAQVRFYEFVRCY